MNATARAIYAHRHTVAYRLERMKELTGLDPTASEDRERLGLGLKALRIVEPALTTVNSCQATCPRIVAAWRKGCGRSFSRGFPGRRQL